MRLVVVESPYAGNVAENVEYAKRCVRDCLERGEAPIASHLLFPQTNLLDDDIPEQRRLGMEAGHAWIIRADAVVVYTDRGVSNGMQLGVHRAAQAGVPIEYRSLEK